MYRYRKGLLVLAVVLVACIPTPIQPSPNAEGVIIQDDFSNENSGWDKHAGSDITTNYDNGQYLIAVETPNLDAWGLAGLDVNDAQISAEARYAAGPLDNSFGVLCRYTRSGNESSFYFIQISSDGYMRYGKVVKNAPQYLNATGDFEPLAAIVQGESGLNQVQAICQAQRISFSVNGQSVGEFEDTELTHGDVGLLAGTLNTGGVKIHFDNVVVKQP